MSQISPNCQKVYDYCRAEVVAGREFPHMGEIADHMGWYNGNPVRKVKACLAQLVNEHHMMTRRIAADGQYDYEIVERK